MQFRDCAQPARLGSCVLMAVLVGNMRNYVRMDFKTIKSFSAVCQMTPQRFELLGVLKWSLLLQCQTVRPDTSN